jgi:hypothetical protein
MDPGVPNHIYSVLPRGSGIADPGAQNHYQFSMMPRGSGDADPGAQNRYQFFYDAARIRGCGSGRAEPLSIFYGISVPYFCFNTGTVFLFSTGTVFRFNTGTVSLF